MTRRAFLRLAGNGLGIVALVSCSTRSAATPTPLQPVTAPASPTAGPAAYVTDLDRLPAGYGSDTGQDQSLLLVSLQGLVNRAKPTLWLKSNPGQTPGMNLWEQAIPSVRSATVLTYAACIQQFTKAGPIKGLVVADAHRLSTYDLATTLAGIDDLLIVTERTLADVKDTNLPIRYDLRGQYQDDLAVIARLRELRAQTDPTMMMRQTPWNDPQQYHAPERTRDYAIQRKHLVVPVGGQYPLSSFYADDWPAHILYGQSIAELDDVSAASSHGKVWLGVNTNTYNLSFLSMVDANPTFTYTNPITALPALEKKVYLSFVFSDGDNIKMNVETMARNWQDPARGTLPLGWTIAPFMADIAPVVLQHYYATRTDQDCFVAGVSGLAYYYTNAINTSAWPDFWPLTQKWLGKLQLSVVWTFGQLGIDRTDERFLEQFVKQYPPVIGWLDGFGDPSGRHGLRKYKDSTIRMVAGRPNVPWLGWLPDSEMSTPEQMLSVAKQDLEAYVAAHPERPLFVPVGVPIYPPHNWSPTKITELLKTLNISDYQVLRPDVMLKMVSQTAPKP